MRRSLFLLLAALVLGFPAFAGGSEKNRERLARLLTLEQGKTYSLALGEVDATVDYINFPAQGARRLSSPPSWDTLYM